MVLLTSVIVRPNQATKKSVFGVPEKLSKLKESTRTNWHQNSNENRQVLQELLAPPPLPTNPPPKPSLDYDRITTTTQTTDELQLCDNVLDVHFHSPAFVETVLDDPMQESEEDEYEEQHFNYLRISEQEYQQSISPEYMTQQIQLNWNMRSLLVDWLSSVNEEYGFHHRTLHLTVQYIDAFLNKMLVARDKLQLLGTASMMIAAKFEEVYVPEVSEWSFLTRDTFDVRQIQKMEQLVLKTLDFRLNAPTIQDFIDQLVKKWRLKEHTKHLAMYLSELVLLEGADYLYSVPSKLACAAILLARLAIEPPTLVTCSCTDLQCMWPENMAKSTGYTVEELSPVVLKQLDSFRSSPFKQQQSIRNKYKKDKYGCVALIKPRLLHFADENDNY